MVIKGCLLIIGYDFQGYKIIDYINIVSSEQVFLVNLRQVLRARLKNAMS